MPSRPQSYTVFAVFALITHFSTPTSRQLHAHMPQNFKTHVKDIQRNPYKMQPGIPVDDKS